MRSHHHKRARRWARGLKQEEEWRVASRLLLSHSRVVSWDEEERVDAVLYALLDQVRRDGDISAVARRGARRHRRRGRTVFAFFFVAAILLPPPQRIADKERSR